jgi:hypothetical protein
MKSPEGWVVKTTEEVRKEFGMVPTKKLRSLGFTRDKMGQEGVWIGTEQMWRELVTDCNRL